MTGKDGETWWLVDSACWVYDWEGRGDVVVVIACWVYDWEGRGDVVVVIACWVYDWEGRGDVVVGGLCMRQSMLRQGTLGFLSTWPQTLIWLVVIAEHVQGLSTENKQLAEKGKTRQI